MMDRLGARKPPRAIVRSLVIFRLMINGFGNVVAIRQRFEMR